MMAETIDHETGEITDLPDTIPAGIAVRLARAEIDMQISTARAYPRSPFKVQKAILDLVTLDEEAAKESMFALPRGGKPVTGPSIRFAEAVKQSYGNCRASSRVVDINREEKYVEAEGVFFDLETNVATKVSHRRRVVDRNGKLFTDDMILVTGNAAASIAMRECILRGVPKQIWRRGYEAVIKAIAGDIKTLAVRRSAAIKEFAVWGVKPEQIFASLGVEGEADIMLDHITVLAGMYSSVKNGEATVEDLFPERRNARVTLTGKNNPLNDEEESPKADDKPKPDDKKAEPKPEDKPKADSKPEPEKKERQAPVDSFVAAMDQISSWDQFAAANNQLMADTKGLDGYALRTKESCDKARIAAQDRLEAQDRAKEQANGQADQGEEQELGAAEAGAYNDAQSADSSVVQGNGGVQRADDVASGSAGREDDPTPQTEAPAPASDKPASGGPSGETINGIVIPPGDYPANEHKWLQGVAKRLGSDPSAEEVAFSIDGYRPQISVRSAPTQAAYKAICEQAKARFIPK